MYVCVFALVYTLSKALVIRGMQRMQLNTGSINTSFVGRKFDKEFGLDQCCQNIISQYYYFTGRWPVVNTRCHMNHNFDVQLLMLKKVHFG